MQTSPLIRHLLRITVACSIASSIATPTLAEEPEDGGGGLSLEETAKQLNNPISSVWNMVFQNNYTILDGDITSKARHRWLTNFQPVMPIPLTQEVNFIARPIIPFLSAPVSNAAGGFDQIEGMGDIAFQGFLSPSSSSGFLYGVGPLFQFPSATNDRIGNEKWSAGGAVVALNVSKNWVIGGLLSHTESFAGSDDRTDVSTTSLQYFIVRMLPNRWQVGTGTPTITANWEADGGDTWTVPIGLSVGRTIRVGRLPIQLSLEASYAVVHPDTFGERWNFRLIVKPVLPALVREPIFGR